MSDKINNGGPAFPQTELSETEMRINENGRSEARTDYNIVGGMSLRDYFAAKAMQGLLSYTYAADRFRGDLKCAAIEAYEIADAMLEAREK